MTWRMVAIGALLALWIFLLVIPRIMLRNASLTGRPMLVARVGIVVLASVAIAANVGAQQHGFWRVADGVAHTSVLLPEARKPNTYATLTIEYSIVAGHCQIMVGMAVMSGRSYGTPKASRKVEDDMTVKVLGMHKWTAKPIVAIYSNGFEAAIPASETLIDELRAGSTVHVHTLPNTPTIEFSLRGSKAAITQASSACN